MPSQDPSGAEFLESLDDIKREMEYMPSSEQYGWPRGLYTRSSLVAHLSAPCPPHIRPFFRLYPLALTLTLLFCVKCPILWGSGVQSDSIRFDPIRSVLIPWFLLCTSDMPSRSFLFCVVATVLYSSFASGTAGAWLFLCARGARRPAGARGLAARPGDSDCGAPRAAADVEQSASGRRRLANVDHVGRVPVWGLARSAHSHRFPLPPAFAHPSVAVLCSLPVSHHTCFVLHV